MNITLFHRFFHKRYAAKKRQQTHLELQHRACEVPDHVVARGDVKDGDRVQVVLGPGHRRHHAQVLLSAGENRGRHADASDGDEGSGRAEPVFLTSSSLLPATFVDSPFIICCLELYSIILFYHILM